MNAISAISGTPEMEALLAGIRGRPPLTISKRVADEIRTMLSTIQAAILFDGAIPEDVRERIVGHVSKIGFPAVDRLEGVVR